MFLNKAETEKHILGILVKQLIKFEELPMFKQK